MLVRCSWCEKDFHSDRYGRQFCPHCGAELDLPAPAAQEAVPTPRTLQPGEGGGPGGAGGGGFGGPPGGGGFGEGPPQDEDAPWEQRDRLGFLPALVETWKRASLDPKAFYARLRTTGIGDAFLYGLILSTLGTALAAIWSLVLSGFTGEDPVVGLGQLVASPIFAAIGLFVGAGLVHLGCMVFGCANRGFDATFRAVAYAQGPQILAIFPFLGGLAAAVWTTVLTVHGIQAMQRTTTGKAIAAVVVPGLVIASCCCGAIFFAAASLGMAMSGGLEP